MVTQLALLALSIGLSVAASHLRKKKEPNVANVDKPTTVATRGSFLPRVIGRRRVGPIFAWAGDRTKVQHSPGKKGGLFGSTEEIEIFFESAWHLLCIGPGSVLHEIEQNGEIIFSGPITPTSHPSGTSISVGDGTFRIFWGEVNQPINTFLGDVSRVGISSRWPNVMYLEWQQKNIGQHTPRWPLMTYDIEAAPSDDTHLSDTNAYVSPSVWNRTVWNGGEIPPIPVNSVTNGAEGVGKFVVVNVLGNIFPDNYLFRLEGNTGLPDQDFFVHSTNQVLVGGAIATEVYPVGGLAGATADGVLLAFTPGPDDGYNHAHILADLWFSPWPHGIGQAKTPFDMQSLEALGTLLESENIKGSVEAKDGQDLRALMGGIHQDIGALLPHNFRTGLLEWVAVREPSGTLPQLTDDVIVSLPEVETLHGERPSDRVLFSFPDREQRFRKSTIGVDDTGQAAFQDYFRAKPVDIVSVVDFGSAAEISERRSQEELSGGADYKIEANRATRSLLPGTYIVVSGIEEILMVSSVKTDPLSGLVELKCLPDFMGATRSDFVQNKGGTSGEVAPVAPDVAFQIVEIPEWLSGAKQMVVVVRVRAHNQIDGAAIFISRDDSSYTLMGQDGTIMQGGTLTAPVDAGDLWEQDDGPVIDSIGPDIGSVLDLSSDTVSWRRGRQLCIIGSEICFLKTIESLGGDQYRLKGLIRGRYATKPVSHSAGEPIYILQNDDGLTINDTLIEPQVTLFAKSQPIGKGSISLSSILSDSLSLYGNGIRPVPVAEIRVDELAAGAGMSTHSWSGSLGGDIPLTWGYFTPRSAGTGAGFSGAGTPQSPADPEGDFIVEILDSLDAVVRTETATTSAYTYSQADRLSDFGAAEPALFKVRVTQLRAGLSADAVTQTFTNVAP